MQSTWDWAIPCWGKVAVARGKRGLGKVANVDWHEISAYAIKNETIRSGSKNSKICHLSSASRPSNPVKHLRQRQGATGDTWSGNIAPRMADGSSSRGPHPARPGYMCCRACTAESTAPRSTVHLKRIPEGPCAKARLRHGAHRRHGALGDLRPSSAALRVNDPRTVSKVVCPRPPRTSRCCSARSQPRASTAGKSSSLERRGRANVQVRAAELLAFLLTEQHYRWCNCMC
jgi:hypothetical protein